MRRVLALVVVLGVGSARAEEPDALTLLDQGIALFKANDLPAARERFDKARQLVPDKANPYRWLGLVDARLGHCAEAVTELDTFMQKAPADDPRVVEAVTIRDRCKSELQPKLGALVVESSPDGAEVRLDDERATPVGTTPYHNDALTIGPHVVFLRKAGYQPVAKGLTMRQGETVRLDLSLPPEPKAPQPQIIVQQAPPPPEKPSRSWIAGPVVGAVGLAATVVFVVLYELTNGFSNDFNAQKAQPLPAIVGGP